MGENLFVNHYNFVIIKIKLTAPSK